jgi:uncharacterized protein (TIGR02996 family)
MNQENALLRAICENIDDDTPRLVFADYLEERGEEAWAQFIRSHIAATRAGVAEFGDESNDRSLKLEFVPPKTVVVKVVPPDGPDKTGSDSSVPLFLQWAKRLGLPDCLEYCKLSRWDRGFPAVYSIESAVGFSRSVKTSLFSRVPIRHFKVESRQPQEMSAYAGSHSWFEWRKQIKGNRGRYFLPASIFEILDNPAQNISLVHFFSRKEADEAAWTAYARRGRVLNLGHTGENRVAGCLVTER